MFFLTVLLSLHMFGAGAISEASLLSLSGVRLRKLPTAETHQRGGSSVLVNMCFGTHMRAFREHIPRSGILKASGLGAGMLNYSGVCQIVFLSGCTALHSFSNV